MAVGGKGQQSSGQATFSSCILFLLYFKGNATCYTAPCASDALHIAYFTEQSLFEQLPV